MHYRIEAHIRSTGEWVALETIEQQSETIPEYLKLIRLVYPEYLIRAVHLEARQQ